MHEENVGITAAAPDGRLHTRQHLNDCPDDAVLPPMIARYMTDPPGRIQFTGGKLARRPFPRSALPQ